MTTTVNTPDMRAALIEARDWFESQAKAVSKGCGSSYELHDLRMQRDALDAALAAPAQAVPAHGVPSDDVITAMLDGLRHARKALNHHNLALECGPVNAAIAAAGVTAAPAKAGEYPKLPEPWRIGAGGAEAACYSAAQMRAYVDSDRAARGAAQATRAVTCHPAAKPDMLVNGGALKLALNVLRRAGKNEVADELECTAQAATVDAERLDYLQECGVTVEVLPGRPGWTFRIGGLHGTVHRSVRTAIDAARAAQKGTND